MDKELKEFLNQQKLKSETLSFPIVERMLDDLKEMKEELDYTKGFIKPYYDKLIWARDDEDKTMELFMKYRDDPDINLEYEYDWDPAGVGWEMGYGSSNANDQYTITMAEGGSHWWNYVIRNMDGAYVIYREDTFGLHLQEEGSRLLGVRSPHFLKGAQYLKLFDDEHEEDDDGDGGCDLDYADYWLKDDRAFDICDIVDFIDVWEGEDPEDMGR